jgi:NADH-quinone oxidoreductase subunit L
MKWPLILLAVPSVLGGLWGINRFVAAHFFPGEAAHEASGSIAIFAPFEHAPLAALAGLAAVAFGYSFARALYLNAAADPIPQRLTFLARAMRNRFYFDELYRAVFIKLHDALSGLAAGIDRWLIAGAAVRGAHGTTEILGRALRTLQTGNLQTYAFLIVLGVAGVVYLFLNH